MVYGEKWFSIYTCREVREKMNRFRCFLDKGGGGSTGWKVSILECRLCGHQNCSVYSEDILDEDFQECSNCGHHSCGVVEDVNMKGLSECARDIRKSLEKRKLRIKQEEEKSPLPKKLKQIMDSMERTDKKFMELEFGLEDELMRELMK